MIEQLEEKYMLNGRKVIIGVELLTLILVKGKIYTKVA